MNYLTVSKFASNFFKEKKSKFIGYISQVKTNNEAIEFIDKIKSMHHKAKHNVYAYILQSNNIARYSDDGEPQGTAGIPVLEVLQKRKLTDVCIVVTRYFGGVLLGIGNLIRAYTHAAALTCDAANIIDMRLGHRLKIKTNYCMYGNISYILSHFEVIIAQSDFGSDIDLEVFVLSEKLKDLQKELTKVTNGYLLIEDCGEIFENFFNKS